jgi:N-acyl-D-amino-acid deacylase
MSRPLWTTLIICLAALACRADELPITGAADPRLAGFDQLMQSFVKEHDVPGAALAVARHGRLVYSRGFGYADVAHHQSVDPDALFRIASVTKPFTAAAVLQLQERGKLRLDAPAFPQLGKLPLNADPRLARITIRQLLQHTGGFDRGASFDPMFRPIDIASATGVASPPAPRQIVQYMMGRPLDFDPGSRYCYSNFGYCTLGQLIEKVSGIPYATYVQREILAPLGITRMRIGRTLESQRAPGEVRYYPRGDPHAKSIFAANLGRDVPVAYGGWCLESMEAHGGWIASAPELVRFASTFDDAARCPILKSESIAEMFARPPTTGFDDAGKPKAVYYACGWDVRPVGSAGKMNTWHTGLLAGTASLLVRRYDGLTWAVLFNADNDANNKYLAGLIDPLVHPVATSIKEWPEGREFVEPK